MAFRDRGLQAVRAEAAARLLRAGQRGSTRRIAAWSQRPAVIGIFSVVPRAGDRSGMSAINRGFFISAIFSVIGVAALV